VSKSVFTYQNSGDFFVLLICFLCRQRKDLPVSNFPDLVFCGLLGQTTYDLQRVINIVSWACLSTVYRKDNTRAKMVEGLLGFGHGQ
jgi:hypothetical protein